jgi:tRNA modification GTPase
MRAPRSFTGEDVVEIHGHGGRLVARSVLEAALRNGARLADPGEFTRRAFLLGKIDLTQAEAVADLVRARTDHAARVARRQLDGALGAEIRAAAQRLLSLVADVEARIDFPEDDVPREDRTVWDETAASVAADLERLADTAARGRWLREGARVAIAGRPNVGKSSLLNALAGRMRAIVSEHPGTTRDTVEAEMEIDGLPVILVDTAGLRESHDPVEQLGVNLSRDTMRDADAVVFVIDAAGEDPSPDRHAVAEIHRPCLVAINKIDLLRPPRMPSFGNADAVAVSAKTGEGLQELVSSLAGTLRADELGGGEDTPILVNARHRSALEDAREAIERGRAALAETTLDRVAADWRLGWEELGTITGETAPDQILDLIFDKFCIGK